MPTRAPKACAFPACGRPTQTRYCDRHQPTETIKPWATTTTSSTERGYGSTWQRIRKVILRRDPICRACQRAASAIVDHIRAKAHGGTDDESNLQGLCRSCHAQKTGQDAARGRQSRRSKRA